MSWRAPPPTTGRLPWRSFQFASRRSTSPWQARGAHQHLSTNPRSSLSADMSISCRGSHCSYCSMTSARFPCLPMMNRLLHFEGPPILTWWRSFSSAQRAVGRASRPLGRVDHLIASRIHSFDLLLLFDEGSWLAGTAPPWAPVPPYFLIRRSTASGTNPASHFDPWRSRASSPWMPSLPRPGAFTNPPPLRPRCNESCPRAPLPSRPLEVLPGAAAAAPVTPEHHPQPPPWREAHHSPLAVPLDCVCLNQPTLQAPELPSHPRTPSLHLFTAHHPAGHSLDVNHPTSRGYVLCLASSSAAASRAVWRVSSIPPCRCISFTSSARADVPSCSSLASDEASISPRPKAEPNCRPVTAGL
jgi:hypothetical protein